MDLNANNLFKAIQETIDELVEQMQDKHQNTFTSAENTKMEDIEVVAKKESKDDYTFLDSDNAYDEIGMHGVTEGEFLEKSDSEVLDIETIMIVTELFNQPVSLRRRY